MKSSYILFVLIGSSKLNLILSRAFYTKEIRDFNHEKIKFDVEIWRNDEKKNPHSQGGP